MLFMCEAKVCVNNVNEKCSDCGYCSRKCVKNESSACGHCGGCEEQFVPYPHVRTNCSRCHGVVALNGKEKQVPVFDSELKKFVDATLCDECHELHEHGVFYIHKVPHLDCFITSSKSVNNFTDKSDDLPLIEQINDHIFALGYSYAVKKENLPINIDEVDNHTDSIKNLLYERESFNTLTEAFVFHVLDILSFYKSEFSIFYKYF